MRSFPLVFLFFINLATLAEFAKATTTTMKRVAVVTGSNKGIGKEIARNLALKGFHVVLACRDGVLGAQACDDIKGEGLNHDVDGRGQCGSVECLPLDICATESIDHFIATLNSEYAESGIHVLVNNAAIAFKGSDPTPFDKQAEPTFRPNFFGTVELTTKMLPLLQKAATLGSQQDNSKPKIVNVASMAGHLRVLSSTNPDLAQNLSVCDANMSVQDILNLAQSFVADVTAGVHKERGWPNSNYGMSKLFLIAYTKVLAKQHKDIQINCCCPGYVATDMSSHRGTKTPSEGAVTPTLLATLIDQRVSGQFWSDGRPVEW